MDWFYSIYKEILCLLEEYVDADYVGYQYNRKKINC